MAGAVAEVVAALLVGAVVGAVVASGTIGFPGAGPSVHSYWLLILEAVEVSHARHAGDPMVPVDVGTEGVYYIPKEEVVI